MSVKQGSKIKVEYEGTLDDGTIFDASEKHGQPLEFEVGTGKVIKGFEEAVMGMEKGEEKEFKIEPKDAYGLPNPNLIKKIKRSQLPEKPEPEVGMVLLAGPQGGQQLPVRITEVADGEVTLDLNHPLAGKNLNFKIKVVEIN